MRKSAVVLGVAASAATLVLGMTAFAAGWKQDSTGWWWEYDGGSYPIVSWEWLDGNGDGIAECYYFDMDGYMAADTTVDVYTVNADGAWTVNGVVQTKQTGVTVIDSSSASTATQQASSSSGYTDDYSGTYRIYTENDDEPWSITIKYNASNNTIDVTNSVEGTTLTYTYGGVTEYDGCTFFEYEDETLKDSIDFSAPGVIHWWDGSSIERQ